MKILVYTNILTSYRVHFFDSLFKILKEDNNSFRVAVMAKKEPNRSEDYEDLKTEYSDLLKSRTCSFRGKCVHFNFGLGKYLKMYQPDIIICAGGYFSPGNIFISIAKRFYGYKTIFWSESHENESRKYGRLKKTLRELLRTVLYPSYDAFFYAGKLSKELITKYAKKSASLFYVPNTVNEKAFSNRTFLSGPEKVKLRQQFGLPLEKRIFFCPARLIPEKGILEFINLYRNCVNKFKATVIIAGDGPLRESIKNEIKKNNLDIRLLGNRKQQEIIQLYLASDFFLLPSVSDANPLTCIEALWCAKPLIVSKNVGNYPEVVKPFTNGVVFDYKDGNSSKIIDDMINIDNEWLNKASTISYELACKTYVTHDVANRTINFMYGLIK